MTNKERTRRVTFLRTLMGAHVRRIGIIEKQINEIAEKIAQLEGVELEKDKKRRTIED